MKKYIRITYDDDVIDPLFAVEAINALNWDWMDDVQRREKED